VRRHTRHLWLLATLVSLAGCGDPSEEEPAVTAPDVITVTSTAFQNDQPIPARFSCDGDNVSPPLAWQGVPAEARALALVVDDPDAPRGTFVHWVVLDISPSSTSVPEAQVPAGGRQATNSADNSAYFGPCPPSGTHHYRFTVYALSAPTGLPDGTKLGRALEAIESAAVARGRLVGTYARNG
jgi:Raf kinase inhibitor-like YbhB/YbcL family protein